jgi:tellurite resistance protein TehA-like permease
MQPAAPPRHALSVRDLPPNIFAIVMATGIVSLASHGAGWPRLANGLFLLNIALFPGLLALFIARVLRHPAELLADFHSHAKAPGFFSLVAAQCVLGSQFALLPRAAAIGLALWVGGAAVWFALSYVMVPALMEGTEKPKPETGLSGAWLLSVVGTQALCVLACRLVPALAAESADGPLFVALAFWLVGSMLYIWQIALIYHRILFLPLSPRELTPPYWINMGAMAISTLAGVCLIDEADRSPLLGELGPFLKGMTLLFWATATWWIPVLVALGAWRHLAKRVPLTYEHGYWAAVFPLGMYTVCTQNLIRVFQLRFLEPIPAVFVWIALTAWGLTFAGLVRHFLRCVASWRMERAGPLRVPAIAGDGRGETPTRMEADR